MPTKTESKIDRGVQFTSDLLRTIFFTNVQDAYLEVLKGYQGLDPEIQQALQDCVQSNQVLQETIMQKLHPDSRTFFQRKLDQEIQLDIANFTELLCKIGTEQGQEQYEDFLGMVMDLLLTVFDTQSRKNNIYFGKYKALFQFMKEEVKRDQNHEPPHMNNTKEGGLFIRCTSGLPPQELPITTKK